MQTTPENFTPIKDGLKAARANLVPGLALQALALSIVLAYYFYEPFGDILRGIAEFKGRTGYLYSLVATAVFGGIIPFLYLKLSKATRASTPWSYLAFYIAFWAYKGIEVDLLYRFQALLFGEGVDAWTIARKVAVDQFVYGILWATPSQVIAFMWKDGGFKRSAFAGLSFRRFATRDCVRALLSGWSVWLPMVCIIYSLPSELQIPLFNIVLCFWVLLLSALMANRAKASSGTGGTAAKGVMP